MDLSGIWRAAISSDDRRRDALGADPRAAHRLTDWSEIRVPGHWQTHRDLAGHHGSVLFSREFSCAPPEAGRRRWLSIDGIFSEGDVWLDGAYLGDLEGYAQRHEFEITALSALDADHHLVIEVSSPRHSPHQPLRSLTGSYQSWPGIDPDWNPGGIRGPVTLRDTGPVSIQNLRVLCRDADEARAHVLVSVDLEADATRRIRLRTSVDGTPVAETEHQLAAGANEVAWTLDIPEPALWWPRSRGAQPLSEITIEVVHEGTLSDTASRVTGFREVAWEQWICSVNGQRIFLKGANLLPTRPDIANVTEAEILDNLNAACDAGLDMVRIHSHLAADPLYRIADEMGIVILQDLGLSARYARSVRPRALAHARATVDRLGHHPSILMWNAHDDPGASSPRHEPRSRGRGVRVAHALREQLPSWNRTVLDRYLKRAVERADPTRVCVPSSGVPPHLPMIEGTDSHLWLGWTHGRAEDLSALARALPRQVRFVSEFGAMAVHEGAEIPGAARWPQIDLDLLRERFGEEIDMLVAHCPPDRSRTVEVWRAETQRSQANLIRTYVETLRRLKYRPTGGFGLMSLNSPTAAISYAVVDPDGRRSPGFDALRAACAPVLVVADRLEDPLRPGSPQRIDIHVVSDLVEEIAEAHVRIEISGVTETWEFLGDIPADSCSLVGRVEFDVPAGIDEISISIALRALGRSGPIEAENCYRYEILRT